MIRLHAGSLTLLCMAVLLSGAGLAAADDSRLADAVRDQDGKAARALLKQRVDVNAPQADGSTALHWAAHWNDIELAGLLIAAGAKVNAETDLGATPLYLAAEIGSAHMTKALLIAGADANKVPSTGVSPLMLAGRAGTVEAIRALLAHKADVNARENVSGQTALMWAAAQKHPDAIKVLAEHGADIHARSRTSSRLLNMGGVSDGDTSAVETIETGGSTALLFAVRNGDIESARVLLESGANVNDTLADGNSALVVAAHSGHGGVARFLLEKGANPNATGAGYSVLHAAVLRDDLDLVKAALARGSDPNFQVIRGTPARRSSADYFIPKPMIGATPFLLAARYGSVEMMRALVAAGADPRLTKKDGTTPLMAAANNDRRRQALLVYARPEDMIVAGEAQGLEAATMLVELGVDVNAADETGNTALHIASSGHLDTIVRFLAEHGARLDVKNARGQTPLALASIRRRGADASEPNKTAELLKELGAKE